MKVSTVVFGRKKGAENLTTAGGTVRGRRGMQAARDAYRHMPSIDDLKPEPPAAVEEPEVVVQPQAEPPAKPRPPAWKRPAPYESLPNMGIVGWKRRRP